jgi:dTDP-4-dehydrorhamnose reductase
MPRILLLGKYGQLGWELQRALATLGPVQALDYPEINLLEIEKLRSMLLDQWKLPENRPEFIINATAYTAVDRAESEPDVAYAINAAAPGLLANLAAQIEATLLHFSTDYVFDGRKNAPYCEADAANPLNVYGKSKLAGEQAISEVACNHLILRTSWVYSLRRDSFVTKALEWARKQTTMQVVSDQVSNPTWARMLAEITAQLVAMISSRPPEWLPERCGLYHLAGDGYASRMEWAQAILELDPRRQEQIVKEITPALTSQFPSPAERPLFSALNCQHFSDAFGLRLPPWKQALQLAMQPE